MKQSLRKQLLIVACVNVGQFMDGYNMGWAAPAIPKLQDGDQTPLPYVLNDMEVSYFGSAIYIGVIMGPFLLSYLSNTYGRKSCLVLAGLINLMVSILTVATTHIWMIFAIRVLSGLGIGLITVTNLVYIGEIASTNIRGILLSSTSIIGILGTLSAYALGPYVSYAATGYVGLVVNVVHILLMVYIPESPVYYAVKGRETECKKVLRILGRIDDLDNVFAIKESPGNTWLKVFTVKTNRVSLFITFTLFTLQQLSGIAIVLFYATKIFQLAGSSIKPDVATILIGLTRWIASSVAPLVVEKMGRKKLLQISTAFCALSLAMFGGFFFLMRVESPVVEKIRWLPLFALAMYLASYEIGFGNIPGALMGEMFESDVRSTGSTIAINSAWLLGFSISIGFGSMVNTLGGDVTFGIFSVSCVLAFLFTCKFVPETKGRSLNEIQNMLSKL